MNAIHFLLNIGFGLIFVIFAYFGYNQYKLDLDLRKEQNSNFFIKQLDYQKEFFHQDKVDRNDKKDWLKPFMVLEKIE